MMTNKRESQQRYYNKNKERVKKRTTERRLVRLSDPAERLKSLAIGALKRAERDGLPSDPSIVTALMENPPSSCACCGSVLDYSTGGGRGNIHKRRLPSIDRVDNNGGYVLDNIEVICTRCNVIKGDASLFELEMVVEYMRKRKPSNGWLQTKTTSTATATALTYHKRIITRNWVKFPAYVTPVVIGVWREELGISWKETSMLLGIRVSTLRRYVGHDVRRPSTLPSEDI